MVLPLVPPLCQVATGGLAHRGEGAGEAAGQRRSGSVKAVNTGVLGIFPYLDTLLQAIRGLQQAGYRDFTVLAPVPRHEIEAILERGVSPVRYWTFFGGLIGAITGFALTVVTSIRYPLITGGKPIVSLPAFFIIAFALTILSGAISTILGMLWHIRLPRIQVEAFYDPRFSQDTFGLWVPCSPVQSQDMATLLRSLGAEEVHLERA
ncbi:MAG: DUF3341 domain-containing protein [Nitrospinota bacterium]|nr:MAG: DUF3341 domain-containing protein [Nitrospinota bacterium]